MGGSAQFRKSVSGKYTYLKNPVSYYNKPWHKLTQKQKESMIAAWVKDGWNQDTTNGIATDGKSVWVGNPANDDGYYLMEHRGSIQVDVDEDMGTEDEYKDYFEFITDDVLSDLVKRVDNAYDEYLEDTSE